MPCAARVPAARKLETRDCACQQGASIISFAAATLASRMNKACRGMSSEEGPFHRVAGVSYFFFVADFGVVVRGLATALAVGLADALALRVGARGMSPRRRLAGQILNAGHFLQPKAMATGQTVTGIPLVVVESVSVWTWRKRENSSFRLNADVLGCSARLLN